MQFTITNTTLPSTAEHHEDELFGSWLYRTALHNGLKSIRGLMTYLNIPTNYCARFMHDIPKASDITHELLRHLGLSYKECITNMSTAPYHIYFNSSSQQEFISSISDHGINNTCNTHIRKRLSNRTTRKAIQWCSVCAKQEILDHGEPYLHRAHQLHGTRYCHAHATELISRCPSCRTTLVSASHPTTPILTCSCGHDLTPSIAVPENDPWLLLAKFEYSALNDDSFTFASKMFQSYLDYRLSEEATSGNDRLSKVANILNDFYGELGAKWLFRNKFELDIEYGKSITILNYNVQNNKSGHYCALLTALDREHKTSISRFSEFISNNSNERTTKKNYTIKKHRTIDSVAFARSIILELISANPGINRGIIRTTRRHAFWYLILFDIEWIRNIIKWKRAFNVKVPTIEQDREQILHFLNKSKPNYNMSSTRIYDNYIRASYRDKVWLEETVSSAKFRKTTIDKDATIKHVMDALTELRRNIAATPSSVAPKRITIPMSAKKCGLSVFRLRGLCKTHEEINKLAKEDSSSFYLRALRWAAAIRVRQGKSLSPSAIAVQSGLTYRGEVIPLAHAVVQEYLTR